MKTKKIKKQLLTVSKISLITSLIFFVGAFVFTKFQNRNTEKEIFEALYKHSELDPVIKGDTAYFIDNNGKYYEKRKITLMYKQDDSLYFATEICPLVNKVSSEDKLDKIPCMKNSLSKELSIGLGKMRIEDNNLQVVSYKESFGFSDFIFHNSIPEVKELGSGKFGFWYRTKFESGNSTAQETVTLYIYDPTLTKNDKDYLTKLFRGRSVDPTLFYDDPIGFRRVFTETVVENCTRYSRGVRDYIDCQGFTSNVYFKDNGRKYKDIVVEKKYIGENKKNSKEVFYFNEESKKYEINTSLSENLVESKESIWSDDFQTDKFKSSVLTEVYNKLLDKDFQKYEINVGSSGLGFAWRIPEVDVNEEDALLEKGLDQDLKPESEDKGKGYKAVILDEDKLRHDKISFLTVGSEEPKIYYEIQEILEGEGLVRDKLNIYEIDDKRIIGYTNMNTYCLLELHEFVKGYEVTIICSVIPSKVEDEFREINLGNPFDSFAFYIVTDRDGDYASGYTCLLETPISNVGSVDWIAKKEDSEWEVIWYGSLNPPCDYMYEKGVPESIYGVCYDHSEVK